MKRSYGVYWFICLVLGMAVCDFLMQAIQNSSIIYGVFAVMAIIASVLNIACGADKNNNKK